MDKFQRCRCNEITKKKKSHSDLPFWERPRRSKSFNFRKYQKKSCKMTRCLHDLITLLLSLLLSMSSLYRSSRIHFFYFYSVLCLTKWVLANYLVKKQRCTVVAIVIIVVVVVIIIWFCNYVMLNAQATL